MRTDRSATRVRREIGVYFERQATLPECDTLSDTTASDTTCVNIKVNRAPEDSPKDASSREATFQEEKQLPEVVQTPIEYVLSSLPKALDLTTSGLQYDKRAESINGGFGNVTMGRLRRSHDKEEIIVAVKTLLERFETNVRYAKVKPDKETNFDLLTCSWGVSLL